MITIKPKRSKKKKGTQLRPLGVPFKDRLIKVPCGKCAFCLSNRRSQWMFRIHHEMRSQMHRGYFLTLTYNERSVRRIDGQLSLRFKDVQLFFKRLRKAKYYVKYIAVGEYGSETSRPHYHVILWTDCPAHLFEKFWHRENMPEWPLGLIHCGMLTMASAMYTLKYIIQPKVKVSADEVREPTRAQFSKGLGLAYLTTEVYYWHTDDYENPVTYSYIDGKRLNLPRYYSSKIFTKYQKEVIGYKLQEEFKVKKARERRALEVQGISDVEVYMQRLRIEQANRIISKTKYSQKL